MADDSQRCAAPQCSRPVEARTTGRPGRYCSANCRQSAYRERVRQADAERARAAQLADAKAEAARLCRGRRWPGAGRWRRERIADIARPDDVVVIDAPQ